MLILSRKTNEKIVIGDNVVVTIIDVRNDQVRIGINAPKNVKVYREEVFNAISAENKAAASFSPGSVPELPKIDFLTK
jgi:carbon storage regulator